MTNNQLLDTILKLYLMARQWELSKNPLHQKITFAKVVKSQESTIEEWQIQFLKEQLFADKFLQNAKYGDEEPYTLTDTGVKAAQTGWYVPHSEKGGQERTIRTETIKDFSRSKRALNISIIAIIVPTLISLIVLWLSSRQPTTEEVRQVKEQVFKLKVQFDQQKKTLDSFTTLFGDTLKMANHDK